MVEVSFFNREGAKEDAKAAVKLSSFKVYMIVEPHYIQPFILKELGRF